MKTKEVVIIMGYPAAGKSTVTEEFTRKGYDRLNRDLLGGSIDGLLPRLDALIRMDSKGIVMDNLYPTAKSRKGVLDIASKYKVPVTCVWQATSIEDAQFNAVTRMVRKYGKLLSPDEIKEAGKKDPNCFPPAVLFAYRKEFEKPTTGEGYAKIDVRRFERRHDLSYTNKAILLDKDGTLTTCISGAKFPCHPSDVSPMQGRTAKIKEYADEGYRVLGVSNQSGVAKGDLSEDTLKQILAETNARIRVDIEWSYCPHRIPPMPCYCRKPQIGLGVQFIERYKLDAKQCIFVGDATSDETFAERCGFKFIHSNIFFSDHVVAR